jgi:hypothetical protein
VTSVTYARVLARKAGTASVAGVAAVLLLAGCGDSGGSDKGAGVPGSDASSPSADPAAGTGGTSGTTTAAGGLTGSWLTTSKGSAVALVINGTKAGVFATGGTICSGTAGNEAGMRMIRLTCSNGNKDRAEGMVDSLGKTSMKVTWESALGTETYMRSQGGQLPSGLPTAGRGS